MIKAEIIKSRKIELGKKVISLSNYKNLSVWYIHNRLVIVLNYIYVNLKKPDEINSSPYNSFKDKLGCQPCMTRANSVIILITNFHRK